MADFWDSYVHDLDAQISDGLCDPAPAPAAAPVPPREEPAAARHAAAPAAAQPPREAEEDMCVECGVPTKRGGHQRTCPSCGRIYDYEGEADDRATFSATTGTAWKRGPSQVFAARPSPMFKMTGPEGGRFGRLLDSVAPADSGESRIYDVYSELLNLNNEYRQKHQKVFSQDLLREVAEVYVKDVIEKAGVIRSQNKRTVLAQLVFTFSMKRHVACKKEDVINLFQLSTGLARGESQLRKIGACSAELNQDQDWPCICSTFAGLGLVYDPHALPACSLSSPSAVPLTAADGALIEKLQKAALDLVKTGARVHVGVGCAPRTRATGATYAVLRRAALAGRLPGHWRLPAEPGAKGRGSLDWVSRGGVEIRPQTVRNYLQILARYHSQFVDVYSRHGLASERIEAL
jgi:hypothetical protein